MGNNEGKRYCAICGKDMKLVINGIVTESIGMQATVGFEGANSEYKEFYEQQLGAYSNIMKRDGEINICFECLLRGLGVQPEKLSKHPLSNS